MREERPYCYRCIRPKSACFCASVPRIETKTRFIFLMHPMEAKKSHVGTGRLAHLALPNSEIIVGINFDQEKRYLDLMQDDTYIPLVLYPGEDSIDLSSQKLTDSLPAAKIPLVFIIDGTWPCAKKMMKVSKSLHAIPRVSFQLEGLSQFSMKQQPASYCLSTIESVQVVLRALQKQNFECLGEEVEELLVPLKKTSDFHIACANDPHMNNYNRPSFKARSPQIRKPSKKWEKRNILFQE